MRARAHVAALVAAAALVGAKTSSAHVPAAPRKTLDADARLDWLRRRAHHDRGVLRWNRRHPRARLVDATVALLLREHRVDLRRTLAAIARLERKLVPHLDAWLCIHRYEGDWEDGAWPYIGGLQMDARFAFTYGADFLARHGRPRFTHAGPNGWANAWTPFEQMRAAERAHRSRGFNPWPNTARACGLI